MCKEEEIYLNTPEDDPHQKPDERKFMILHLSQKERIDLKNKEKEKLIKEKSGARVRQDLEIIDNSNPKHYLYNKLKLAAAKYFKGNIPNINDEIHESVLHTYQKLLSGQRLWNEEKYPDLENQFIMSVISEARNRLSKYYYDKKHCTTYLISPETIVDNSPYQPNATQTPEKIISDEQDAKKMELFLEFLKYRDAEVCRIISSYHYHGTDLKDDKILSEELGIPISNVTNAKRRYQTLRIKFQSQYEGDLS